jgi:hypothetical protein
MTTSFAELPQERSVLSDLRTIITWRTNIYGDVGRPTAEPGSAP